MSSMMQCKSIAEEYRVRIVCGQRNIAFLESVPLNLYVDGTFSEIRSD
jgi:hypothetical protein